ncbi:MAG: MurR/RpiR family transcriptional regulator [Sphaerochaeta sp.]|nr:MurR/RpiR family transcriptional regulator [Sphaerochaeta sp.]
MSGCLYGIKQYLPSLAASERKIAEYLMANPMQAVSLGVMQIAQSAGSSSSACIRLAEHLGYSGYSSLRMALAKEVFSSEKKPHEVPLSQITEQTTTREIVHLVVTSTSESIKENEFRLDTKALDSVVDAIIHANHLVISGVGASGIVAADFQQKLTRLGLHAVYTTDSDMQIVEACALSKQDVLVAFSYSGETTSVLKVAREAKKSGAVVVAVTRIGGNSLSRLADWTLCVGNSESLFREGATLSRFGQLLVVDLIYTIILVRFHSKVNELLKRSWDAVAHVSG